MLVARGRLLGLREQLLQFLEFCSCVLKLAAVFNAHKNSICLQPVFYAESGHPFEISKIVRQQHPIMNQHNGSDLEIHGPDADSLTAKRTKHVGS